MGRVPNIGGRDTSVTKYCSLWAPHGTGVKVKFVTRGYSLQGGTFFVFCKTSDFLQLSGKFAAFCMG